MQISDSCLRKSGAELAYTLSKIIIAKNSFPDRVSVLLLKFDLLVESFGMYKTLAKWLLEFLGIPRIFLGIPRIFLGIPRNS